MNAEPAVLPHLVPLADAHPEAVTVATRIILRNGGVTAEDLPSLTERLGEPVGYAAMLSTLKVMHPGTALEAQLLMVERGVMLLEDSGRELLDVIRLVRPSQNALSAIQVVKDPAQQFTRLLALRLHGFLAASQTLGDYLQKAGRLTANATLLELATLVQHEPLSAFLKELRNIALHNEMLPVTPFLRTDHPDLQGTITLSRDTLAQMRKWQRQAKDYLDILPSVIHLEDFVDKHLKERAREVPRFVDTIRDARQATLADAAAIAEASDAATKEVAKPHS